MDQQLIDRVRTLCIAFDNDKATETKNITPAIRMNNWLKMKAAIIQLRNHFDANYGIYDDSVDWLLEE